MLKNSLDLLKKIESYGYEAYIVGGFVRDYYMKNDSIDVDICTNATPKELIKIFNNATLPNEKYGAVTINHKNIRYEITTYRKELKYKMRKPIEIEYTNDLYSDIMRRDFTINSLCMDSKGNIIDFFDGKKDIERKVIKSLGVANDKFKEDPLRILRAIRFATILNFKLDYKVKTAIIKNAIYLKDISFDRKKAELNKIFASKNVKYGIKLINMFGLDKYLDLDMSNFKYTSDILGIWAQVDVNHKYPFSKIEKNSIKNILKIVENKTIGKYEIYKYGLYNTSIAAEVLGVSKNVIVRLERNIPIRSLKDINITTDEIIKLLDRKPGRWIAKLYEDLEIKIVTSKLKNNKDKIKEYIIKNY